MSSMVETLARLHGQTMTEKSEFDFEALRLDWFRLQTLTSVNKAALRSGERGEERGRGEGNVFERNSIAIGRPWGGGGGGGGLIVSQ